MGPICDKLGLEQGGKSSDKFYRLCNNSQLSVAQHSGLGVTIGGDGGNVVPGGDDGLGTHVAAIGQADDVALISSSIHNLRHLVKLTMDYCKQYHVTLVPEKTKLLAFGKQN